MTRSRLISSFLIYDGTGTEAHELENRNLFVNTSASGSAVATLTGSATGTRYFHSDDAAGDDWLLELKTALEAAIPARTFTVDIVGINATSAGDSDGRLEITIDTGTFDLEFGHANSDVDPRTFGWGDTPGTKSSTGTDLVSDRNHRYGWYPQDSPTEDLLTFGLDNAVTHSTNGAVDGDPWQEYEEGVITWDAIPSALVRIHGALDATRAAQVDFEAATTADQINGAYERFILDLAANTAEAWRYYADQTDTAVFKGPFRFRRNSILWSKPTGSPTRMRQKAGEIWYVTIDGRTAV